MKVKKLLIKIVGIAAFFIFIYLIVFFYLSSPNEPLIEYGGEKMFASIERNDLASFERELENHGFSPSKIGWNKCFDSASDGLIYHKKSSCGNHALWIGLSQKASGFQLYKKHVGLSEEGLEEFAGADAYPLLMQACLVEKKALGNQVLLFVDKGLNTGEDSSHDFKLEAAAIANQLSDQQWLVKVHSVAKSRLEKPLELEGTLLVFLNADNRIEVKLCGGFFQCSRVSGEKMTFMEVKVKPQISHDGKFSVPVVTVAASRGMLKSGVTGISDRVEILEAEPKTDWHLGSAAYVNVNLYQTFEVDLK